MIFTFYAYAWIAIIYNFYNYIRIFRIQKKFIHNHGILKKIDGIYLDKLMFIPLIFLFIWLFGTIDRVLECFKICNFTVSVIHAMMESLNGFANTLLYVCNKDIRKEVKNIFSNKVVGETEITN